MLEIYSEGEDNPPEVVYAKPNRLVIFDAGKYVHSVRPVTKGTRKAIAINLWEHYLIR
jgi:predicted 2-oxoglutarate/Fe(II)-dependent dioxygenase YbiX